MRPWSILGIGISGSAGSLLWCRGGRYQWWCRDRWWCPSSARLSGAGTACPCACVCGVYKGALISVGASRPCHNAEIMSLLLSAHSTSSLRWLASSSRQNLPRLKWMCHHLPQQIRSPLMMGQTPLARRATAVIQAPYFFLFFFFPSLPLFPLFPVCWQVIGSPRTWGKHALVGMGSLSGTGWGAGSHGRPASPPWVLGSSRRPVRRRDGFPAWAAIGRAPALPLG